MPVAPYGQVAPAELLTREAGLHSRLLAVGLSHAPGSVHVAAVEHSQVRQVDPTEADRRQLVLVDQGSGADGVKAALRRRTSPVQRIDVPAQSSRSSARTEL